MSDYGNHVIREITYSAFTTGKKLLSSSNNHINIYPNPTQNLVTINAANNKENEKTNIYLLDETGKILTSIESKLQNNTISLINYKSGTYNLQVKIGNNKEDIYKIIKAD
jgi:hypothetical protein